MGGGKRKAYEAHEAVYQRLARDGKKSWSEARPCPAPAVAGVEAHDARFFEDVLSQAWAPRQGLVVEFGCGTAPMLRWFCERGFRGIGLEISKTAAAMAHEQAAGLDAEIRYADVCNEGLILEERADVVIDGHCLHCLTRQEDRERMLRNVVDALKPSGKFVLLSMCGPVDRQGFKELYAPQRLIGQTVYMPTNDSTFDGCRVIGGKTYLPTRHVAHWKNLLRELRTAGLQPRLMRLATACGDEVVSGLAVAAMRAVG